jgi:hypothetical protein
MTPTLVTDTAFGLGIQITSPHVIIYVLNSISGTNINVTVEEAGIEYLCSHEFEVNTESFAKLCVKLAADKDNLFLRPNKNPPMFAFGD